MIYIDKITTPLCQYIYNDDSIHKMSGNKGVRNHKRQKIHRIMNHNFSGEAIIRDDPLTQSHYQDDKTGHRPH